MSERVPHEFGFGYRPKDTTRLAYHKGRMARFYDVPLDAPPRAYDDRQRRAWAWGWHHEHGAEEGRHE